jgi:hypothetical protein
MKNLLQKANLDINSNPWKITLLSLSAKTFGDLDKLIFATLDKRDEIADLTFDIFKNNITANVKILDARGKYTNSTVGALVVGRGSTFEDGVKSAIKLLSGKGFQRYDVVSSTYIPKGETGIEWHVWVESYK